MLRTPVGEVGNIATDPEYGTTRDGSKYARFRFATNERVKVNDQWQDSEGTFHNVVLYGKAAQAFERTFARGDRVAVLGTLEIKAYNDKEGHRRQSAQIRATTVAADPMFEPVHIDRRERGAHVAASVAPSAGTEVTAGVPDVAQAAQQQWATHEPMHGGSGTPNAGYSGAGWA